MRLSDLVEALATVVGAGDPEIDAATLDVDEVRPGTLFVARRGWYGDTHAHLAEAFDRGASAALVSRMEAVGAAPPGVPIAFNQQEDPTLGLICDRLYGQPTRRLRVYGVTGTKGKTTVTYILEHMLRALGEVPALMGTLVYRLGDASVDAPNTTPDALVLQRFAADALRRGATALVLEVSSHALEIGRTAGVLFDSVGFTNLGRDHLDFHGTEAAYFEAKARLFGSYLQAARAAGKAPCTSICLDTPAGAAMVARVAAGVPVRTVAVSGGEGVAGFRVSEMGTPSLAGMRARLEMEGVVYTVDTPLFGDHQLLDAALAAAMLAGTHPDAVAAAWASLADFRGVPGRLERVAPRVFVDYAHTPDSVARILETLRARTSGPVTIVLGCGGDRDRGKRTEMARAAVAGADRVVLTSDNPRSEDPSAILDEMAAGLADDPAAQARVVRIVDRAAAIAQAVGMGDDTVVIAGKGHERSQIVAERRWHFDDREEARRVCAAREVGRAPDAVPLAWGAESANPERLLADTRRRAPGMWVVQVDAADGQDLQAVAAQVEAVVGAGRCLAGSVPFVAAHVTAQHRAVVIGGAMGGLVADAVAGPSFDAAAAYGMFDPGRAAAPSRPRVPVLP